MGGEECRPSRATRLTVSGRGAAQRSMRLVCGRLWAGRLHWRSAGYRPGTRQWQRQQRRRGDVQVGHAEPSLLADVQYLATSRSERRLSGCLRYPVLSCPVLSCPVQCRRAKRTGGSDAPATPTPGSGWVAFSLDPNEQLHCSATRYEDRLHTSRIDETRRGTRTNVQRRTHTHTHRNGQQYRGTVAGQARAQRAASASLPPTTLAHDADAHKGAMSYCLPLFMATASLLVARALLR